MRKSILRAWSQSGSHLSLSQVARRHPQSRQYPGRFPVFAAPFAGAGFLIVRRCVHGGAWGCLTRDFYLGSGRALREIHASERLAKLNIPTPRVEAVAHYPAGPFRRIEMVTSLIPDGQDLVHWLAHRPTLGERTRLFSAVRKLFGQLHRHGVRHPDLNARNILLSPQGRRWTAWLLDVDSIRFEEPRSFSVDAANRHRLLRSLLKRAHQGDLGWSDDEVAGLWHELFPRR